MEIQTHKIHSLFVTRKLCLKCWKSHTLKKKHILNSLIEEENTISYSSDRRWLASTFDVKSTTWYVFLALSHHPVGMRTVTFPIRLEVVLSDWTSSGSINFISKEPWHAMEEVYESHQSWEKRRTFLNWSYSQFQSWICILPYLRVVVLDGKEKCFVHYSCRLSEVVVNLRRIEIDCSVDFLSLMTLSWLKVGAKNWLWLRMLMLFLFWCWPSLIFP